MSVNKFQPHVYVIPEDRDNETIANGFILHDQVKQQQIQVLPCAGGWPRVLDKFRSEYISHLRNYKDGFVILLVDFDGNYQSRRGLFEDAVPPDLKSRVFVLGALDEPENFPKSLGKDFETIGLSLAEDCYRETVQVWNHDHIKHNEPDRLLLIQTVKSILFGN